ncbi:alpha-ketoglutarate-dependent dioxygenase AlkB [Alkalimonas sp.]|uniref:alpha-ketoglutarate-dependent dioxygenase AlkB family protein n=1 Tax=Alkalimonas sp. TaxID=1872453 RepID=UPI00263BC7FC|nr:alpha-ketoglutarate-dependent dioxygenase AlkB [Alkalimonas sp.]MCC5826748.1 alpha-ketoglutarate-dependent dioxygenase AlkB [Alkalimonas sp.]
MTRAAKQLKPECWQLPDANLLLWRGWLPEAEAASSYQQLVQQLAWQQPSIRLFGREHPIPRQQVWMGDANAHYRYSGTLFAPEPWHPLVSRWCQLLSQQLEKPFNSVLVNWYRSGQEHMGWHADNEPELGTEPCIASLSLGQARRFDLKHRQQPWQLQLELGQGDLLLMTGSTQQYWVHRVPKQSRLTAGRLNLTFRYIVPIV